MTKTLENINKISGRNFKVVKELFLRKDSAVGELITANMEGLVVAIYEPWNECLRLVDNKMYYAYDNAVLETKFHHRDFYDIKNTFHNMADQMSLFNGFRMFILEEICETEAVEEIEEEVEAVEEIEEIVKEEIPVQLEEIAISSKKLINKEEVYNAYFSNNAIYILDKNNDIHRIRRSVYTFTSHGIVNKEILNEERMYDKIQSLMEWKDEEDFRFFAVVEK